MAGRMSTVSCRPLRVRLTGTLEVCAQRLMELQDLSRKAVLDYIKRHDTGRRRYLKKYFDQPTDDPMHYDLIINTDRITLEQTTDLILHCVLI